MTTGAMTFFRAKGKGYCCVHMKRTTLMVDEDLLAKAIRLIGEKTYSAVVGRALEDFVRRIEARSILELRGSGLWEGDLEEMRRDVPGKRKRKRR